jgi:Fe-S cluster assembly protein SufA/iron-sulfur cluster assembly protein
VAPDLTLHVSKDAIALLRGTEIDCVKEGLNSVLKFRNPNAEAECGCGESFSVGRTK